MERVSLSEIMPAAGQDTKPVANHRAKYDTRHSHEFRQYDRTNDISTDLESIADIIAKLISITVNHLFQIKNHNLILEYLVIIKQQELYHQLN